MGKIFNVGWSHSGETYVARAMKKCGIKTTPLNSIAAEDILFSKSVKREPLTTFKNHEYISQLESFKWSTGYIIRAQYLYDYLDLTFPGSLFILLTRNVDQWVDAMYKQAHIEMLCYHYKKTPAETINQVIKERKEYETKIKNYFKNNKNFLEIDIFKDGLNSLIEYISITRKDNKLKGDFSLINNEIEKIKQRKISNLPTSNKQQATSNKQPIISYTKQSNDNFSKIVNKLSDHCVGTIEKYNEEVIKPSNFYAEWQPEIAKLSVENDRICQITDGRFLHDPLKNWKLRRVAAILNELSDLNISTNIRSDMQDARSYGVSITSALAHPIITYCRRKGAKNLILWPLPGYHAIGSNAFPGNMPADTLQYDAKKDIAAWRGALSGHCSDVINGEHHTAVHVVAKNIADQETLGRDSSELWSLLKKNIRFKFVLDNLHNNDIDAKIAIKNHLEILAKNEEYGNCFSEATSKKWLYGHKYIICLRGYDTASNFIMVAASNSIALKEEDDWEVFYSCLFEPWVHYIPLKPGATDVNEKITWARNNPEKVTKMIESANDVCNMLADKRLRYAMCNDIARKLESQNI